MSSVTRLAFLLLQLTGFRKLKPIAMSAAVLHVDSQDDYDVLYTFNPKTKTLVALLRIK